MSVPDDPEKPQSAEAIRSEAQRFLDEIKQIRANTEEHLKAVEAARKKADDDATYAYQGKVNAENHAKAVSTFKGQAESEFNAITANKQKTDELLAFITAAKPNIEGDGSAISARRKEVDLAADEISQVAAKGISRLQEIETARDEVSMALAETKSLRDSTIQERNKVESARTEVEQFSLKAIELASAIQTAHASSQAETQEITTLLTSAQSDRESLNQVLSDLKKSHDIAVNHRVVIDGLENELQALLKKVEELLPGAASASLASAFRSQKKRFGRPRLGWVCTFVTCIVLLVSISVPGFIAAYTSRTSQLQWEDILRGIAIRMPIVIPLVWLAIYAGRNYMLSLRLEEDYAYKEAISTAFEGYKREMQQIAAGDATNPAPITTLCINILRAISERPGRIYEGKQEDITLLAELKKTTALAEELRQKTVATQ